MLDLVLSQEVDKQHEHTGGQEGTSWMDTGHSGVDGEAYGESTPTIATWMQTCSKFLYSTFQSECNTISPELQLSLRPPPKVLEPMEKWEVCVMVCTMIDMGRALRLQSPDEMMDDRLARFLLNRMFDYNLSLPDADSYASHWASTPPSCNTTVMAQSPKRKHGTLSQAIDSLSKTCGKRRLSYSHECPTSCFS